MTASPYPPVSPPAAASSFRLSLASLVWLAWMLALTLSFVGFAAASLDSFRPVSADEITALSVSSKLAQEWLLGSDLYSGFYGAERHFFIERPGQTIWQALAFRLAGTGLIQARWVSIVFAVLLLWTLGWLAWRCYDLPTAFVATFIFLVWRSDLVALYPGLPILGVARSARPDISAVAWVWLALAAFTALVARPGRWRAIIVGLCAGAAVLTHFVGSFVVPVLALLWLIERRRRELRLVSGGWALAAFLAVLLPWLLWISLHLDDYRGQTVAFGAGAALGTMASWLGNAAGEMQRYRPLLMALQHWGNDKQAYIGPTLLLALLVPALGYLLVRLWRQRRLGDIVLAASLLSFVLLLALSEPTKTPLYALMLWPALCLAVAVMLVALARWAIAGPGLGLVRLGALAAVIAFLGVTAWDGRRGYEIDWAQMGEVTSYRTLAAEIALALPPQAPVLGENRWWWALRDHPYRGINSVYLLARDAFARSGRLPAAAELLGRGGSSPAPAYILTNNNLVGPRFDYPPGFRAQFWEWVASCTALERQWDDRTYGRIDLYRVESSRAGCLAQVSP